MNQDGTFDFVPLTLAQTHSHYAFMSLQDQEPQAVDTCITAYKCTPWVGTLPFDGHLCRTTDAFCEAAVMQHDLLGYTSHIGYKTMNYIVRFSPLRYPIVGGFRDKESGGQQLITDLCLAARLHGKSGFTSNGSAGRIPKDLEQRVLVCSHGRRHYPRSSDVGEPAATSKLPHADTPYRITTYIGDKKNARGTNASGKAGPRRCSTQRKTLSVCPAQIKIRLDHSSYYFVCGHGSNNHKWHPPMDETEILIRKRCLDPDALKNISAMAVANIQPAQASLFTRSRTGQLFSRGQMAYAQGFSRMAMDLVDAENGGGVCPNNHSAAENMQTYFQKAGASYVCLYHNGKTQEIRGNSAKAARLEEAPTDELTSVFVATSESEESAPSHKCVSLPANDEVSDVKEYAQQSRHAVRATDDQDLLIACCWVIPDGKRLFQAFPEVVCVDGTHETNSESRPLITVSVKDSEGKVSVVLRCFAPNERSWFFRWFFQEALPLLLGPDSLKLVKQVMTDGDSQEMEQVDFAIATFFVNAVRSRCAWHLVHQGWKRHATGLGYRPGKREHARKQIRVIQTWLYSWMRRGVDSKLEYEM